MDLSEFICASLISLEEKSTPMTSSPFTDDLPNLFFKILLKNPSFLFDEEGGGVISGAPSVFFLNKFANGFFIKLYFNIYII